jgi:hypothetical protein
MKSKSFGRDVQDRQDEVKSHLCNPVKPLYPVYHSLKEATMQHEELTKFSSSITSSLPGLMWCCC